MKKVVFALAVVLLASVAWAQQDGGRTGRGEGMRRMASPAEHAKRLSKELGLNQEQATKIQQIFETQEQKRQAERNNFKNLSPEERRAQFMQSRQQVNSQIEAVLNDAQKKKFEEMQARMKDRRGREGHQPDGEQGPPPEQQ